MKTAIIIHGTWGNPEWNWFPWMKGQLESDGWKVFVPEFPTPENQELHSWLEVFQSYKEHIGGETIFIAHSVGPAFVLSVLEQLDSSVKSCYFVAGFLELLQLPEFDILNETITAKQFNWEKIHENCKEFYMCNGEDDPYVPFHNAEILADNLWIEIDIIQNWGHLNEETGYTEFPYLFEKIQWNEA